MDAEFDFKQNLLEMRHNFKVINRHKNESLPKPLWLQPDDALNKIYEEYDKLIEIGEIHYACIVQANTILFKKFPPLDSPACVILSTGEYYDSNPDKLEKIATKLYSYKNKTAPENIKKITDSITDEYDRLYNIELPNSIKHNESAFYTTIMVYRKHLPERKITGSILPVITKPDELQTTIILPKYYWTKQFIEFYK